MKENKMDIFLKRYNNGIFIFSASIFVSCVSWFNTHGHQIDHYFIALGICTLLSCVAYVRGYPR